MIPVVLDPAGPQAAAITWLIRTFTFLCAGIWLLVMVALLIAIFRRHRKPDDPLALSAPQEKRTGFIVGALTVLTGLIVVGLTLLSYSAQQQVFAQREPDLTIEVVGHQWWWELKYDDPDPSQTFTTANEMHVPVGALVGLKLTSSDVIHSFWVPSLMGKADLVPGRENSLTFTADKAGVYAGQCAEFCGLQHTHMGIRVFADTPEQFAAWKAQQIAEAPAPATPSAVAGEHAFMSNPCVSCHAVRGTDAGGNVGPDLTHLASRTTIAAGTAPLTREALAVWITDPQSMKPGSNMPTIPLGKTEHETLLDYLMGLK